MVNVVTVMVCPELTTVLSMVMSPPPPVFVTVPCMTHSVPPELKIRKNAMVPDASAEASCHVPAFAFEAEEAGSIQSDGSVRVAMTDPEFAVPQFAGIEPDQRVITGETPV
jgi:hypothetical protein